MVQIRENWAEALTPLLKKVYDKGVGYSKDFLGELYTVSDSTNAVEYNLGIGEFGRIQKWTDTGNQVYYTDVSKDYKSTYIHEKYSIGTQVERELVMFNKYSQIKSKIIGLKDAVDRSIQYYAMEVFNHAFDSTIVGPDGLSLCNSAHPKIQGSSSTFSNTGVLELNAVNLETTRNLMKRWTDEQGNSLMVNPDLLLVPPELRKTGKIIAETKEEPDITDHGINVWAGNLKLMECELLTDTRRWFLIDSVRMKRFLNWYYARRPDFQQDKEFDTEVAKYACFLMFSYGFDTASWIYGQDPA